MVSNFPIGFNGFQSYVFQSALKNLHRFQWFSNYVLQNVFKCPIGFNGFQIMCLQSVFKFPHRFQWFSKLCVSKCFQISP